MPSPMKQSNTVRQRKLKRRGRWRKNRLENEGTTLSRAFTRPDAGHPDSAAQSITCPGRGAARSEAERSGADPGPSQARRVTAQSA